MPQGQHIPAKILSAVRVGKQLALAPDGPKARNASCLSLWSNDAEGVDQGIDDEMAGCASMLFSLWSEAGRKGQGLADRRPSAVLRCGLPRLSVLGSSFFLLSRTVCHAFGAIYFEVTVIRATLKLRDVGVIAAVCTECQK